MIFTTDFTFNTFSCYTYASLITLNSLVLLLLNHLIYPNPCYLFLSPLLIFSLNFTMASTNSSQSKLHEYGDGSDDESLSSSSSFLNSQEYQEQFVALGGFINLLKAHKGHFYLHPCVDYVIDIITFLEHYIHHDSYLIPITSWFQISFIPSNLGTWS